MVLILREVFTGSHRYEAFKAKLGVADNVLSRRLRTMVDSGLLERVPYRAEQRTHHEYHLTEAGADLLPVLNALALWGEKHVPGPNDESHLTIVHTACGRATASSDVCTACGRQLTAGDTAWQRPWMPRPLTPLSGARPS